MHGSRRILLAGALLSCAVASANPYARALRQRNTFPLSALQGHEHIVPARPPTPVRELELLWPVATTGINSLFGPRHDPVNGHVRFHYGIDLDSTYGTLVGAAAEGRVTQSGWNKGHGRQIVIQHPGGYISKYSHLSRLSVTSGTRVKPGQNIGRVGNSGRSTGPHLHFELLQHGKHIDPLQLLGTAITY